MSFVANFVGFPAPAVQKSKKKSIKI